MTHESVIYDEILLSVKSADKDESSKVGNMMSRKFFNL
jgi:hypothetical protein